MKKISFKGIFGGTIVHYLLGYVLLIIPIVYVLLPLQTQEVGFEQLGNVFLNAIEGSARLPSLQFLAQLVSALAAGFVAARLAGRNELLNGFLGALPCSALAVWRLMTRPDGLVANIDYVLIAAALMCALFGAFLAAALNRARTRQP